MFVGLAPSTLNEAVAAAGVAMLVAEVDDWVADRDGCGLNVSDDLDSEDGCG